MHPIQAEIYKKMSPEQKIRIAERMYWSARELKAAALRQQNPDWDEERVQRKVKEIFMYATS